MKLKAVYPGTFDPVTFGHLDVIKRGRKLFDELVVGITTNPAKEPFFSLEERESLVQKCIRGLGNVEVKTFDSLLIDFVKKEKAQVILRGLREASDFSGEFTMAIVNRKLDEKIETVFVMTNPDYFYINSGTVREIFSFGGKLDGFVPKPVEAFLRKKMAKNGK